MVRKRIADAHNDYLMHLRSGQRTLDDDMQHQMHTSLESLQKGEVALQVFAAFAEDAEGGAPLLQALEMIHWYGEMLRRWAGAAMPVYDAVSLKNAENAGSIGALLSIEGGEACAGSVLALDTFRRLGVRMMTLLWNRENALGHPACMAAFSGEGLKPFGRACVRFINRNRMAVDVSHLNAGGFRDVCTLSQRPFLASHSNAYAVCPHPRNLTDYQIRAIADAGGFIGLNFFPDFLSNRSESTLEDVLQHARHILTIAGEEVLGFGSDFDGIQSTPAGIDGAQSFPDILVAMQRAGFGEELIDKVAYGNFQRFLQKIFA